jgi:hypothetical protein
VQKRRKYLGRTRRIQQEAVDKIVNERFHDLYLSPDIITVITSLRMRLAGRVACTEETRNT